MTLTESEVCAMRDVRTLSVLAPSSPHEERKDKVDGWRMKNQSLINLVLSLLSLSPSRSHSVSQANVTKQFIVAPATIVKAFPSPSPSPAARY